MHAKSLAKCITSDITSTKVTKFEVIGHLNSALGFVRNSSPYRELIEKLGLRLVKMYVAEYIRSERDALEKAGIMVQNVGDVIKEIVCIVRGSLKKGIEEIYL